MSALPEDVRQLLQAVHDALNIPMAHWDDADEHAHHRILTDRARTARITLAGILNDGHDLAPSVDWLTGRITDSPVTYAVWVPEHAEDGGQR